MRMRGSDNAVSMLSIILHLLLFVTLITITAYLVTYDPGEEPKGLYIRAVEVSRGTVHLAGDPIGYSSVPREVEGVLILPSVHDTGAVGAVRVSFSPVIGDISLDINKISVSLYRGDGIIRLSPSHHPPLNPGEWMVIKRREPFITGGPAERSVIGLGETFDLLIVLPEPLAPDERIRLFVSLRPGSAIRIDRPIPHRVVDTTPLPP
ncbi:hypothetical protein J2T58_000296 [Methanocalculus alkaliphilus]|uniref:hypothetical protein n=1 Tax=Methanocalculus alkaliphilus TaxID=768730 RepID=UPI00209E934A|nr:hypothetical protein [Methanocalculus alkaliphilus]MCP1714469.1 hypothetical protein [Methanocalculus alkaliphilus]